MKLQPTQTSAMRVLIQFRTRSRDGWNSTSLRSWYYGKAQVMSLEPSGVLGESYKVRSVGYDRAEAVVKSIDAAVLVAELIGDGKENHL